jgi:hypothetical protein
MVRDAPSDRAGGLDRRALMIGLTVLSQSAGSDYKNSFSLNGTQSFEAQTAARARGAEGLRRQEQVVLAVKHGKVTDPAIEARANRRCSPKLAALPEVASVASPYAAARARRSHRRVRSRSRTSR